MPASEIDHLEILLESRDFPCDRLRVRRLSGREAISRLFDFDLDVVSLDRDGPDPGAMAGAVVSIVFLRDGAEVRRIHGMVAGVDDLLANRADFRTYRLRVVPRAFRLTLIETQDIFMGLTVPQIIEQKIKLVGLGADLELRLAGAYPEREFVVQYNESDLAFVSRLAEHLGVSFFFEHRGGRDLIILTDHAAGFRPAEGAEAIGFRDRGEERDVFEIEVRRRLVPSYYAVRDYNYRTPHVDLTAEHELPGAFPGGMIEHGGHFKTHEEGKALARARAEERQAGELTYAGRSDRSELAAGARFRLDHHPDLDPIELLVVEVEHEANQVVAASGEGGERSYVNRFTAIPAARTYRPPRITPKPRIAGLMTGVIDAGPTGVTQRAQIDDQGRYMVRFLFDTAAPGERQASRPVRMLQNHVGENYGTHYPLKPGVEVLIGFVHGDPDRPIIVGAAPNPLKPSPVTNRNPSVHRTRTGSGITIDAVDES
jgi:type VI secretion system secreted protein VgrG